jgi:hypothetical protein
MVMDGMPWVQRLRCYVRGTSEEVGCFRYRSIAVYDDVLMGHDMLCWTFCINHIYEESTCCRDRF